MLQIDVAFGCGGKPHIDEFTDKPCHVPLREWIFAEVSPCLLSTHRSVAQKHFFFPVSFPAEDQKMTTIELNRVESFRGSIEKASIMGDIVYVVTLVIS